MKKTQEKRRTTASGKTSLNKRNEKNKSKPGEKGGGEY